MASVRTLIVLTILALCLGAANATAAAEPEADVNSLGLEATYEVQATFDGPDVQVRTVATVRGTKPWSSATLAFNLSTLRTGRAQLTSATVDGTPVEATADDQTLLIPLGESLQPGGTVTVEIDYTARLNTRPTPNTDEWGFALDGGYVMAYRWIPWLTRTTPFDRPSVGDPFVTASSPLVRVSITADPALVFASTGVEIESAGEARVFEARNVRDFNFSASARYQTSERSVLGTRIVFHHQRLSPSNVLDITERAFRQFSRRIGAYPYDTLTIGEVGPWAPLESPMLFWLPDNAPGRLLPWMTAHETGHQWFYGVVGNDQAREPFADEALTDFISRDLINRFVPSQCPPGRLDATIYDLGECYPWVVYVQGDAYLLDYRSEVGAGRFWQGVADYYADHRFGMGGTRQLLLALDAAADRVQIHFRFPSLYPPPLPLLPVGGPP
jgi:hypothetical protein